MANPNNNLNRDEFDNNSSGSDSRDIPEMDANEYAAWLQSIDGLYVANDNGDPSTYMSGSTNQGAYDSYAPINISDFANEAANDVGGQTLDSFIDNNGMVIDLTDEEVKQLLEPRMLPTDSIDINYSGSNQPNRAKPRPIIDPNNPNFQAANQSNNQNGYIDAQGNLHHANSNIANQADVRNYDSNNQQDVAFDYDEHGQATGAYVDQGVVEVSMEERMREQETPADKNARLNTVANRVAFLETLRASTDVKNSNYIHTNMLNSDAYEHVMKINDSILSMSQEKILDEQHRATALSFLDNLAKELKANPNGTLETTIDSDRVISKEDFQKSEIQASAITFGIIAGDGLDSALASVFTMQEKADGNYPFLIDAAGKQPLSDKFRMASLRGLNAKNVGTPKSMSAYLEVKFARENFDSLSDKYKNGVTLDKLDEQLNKFKEFGILGHIRASNRNLDKNPEAANLFMLDGIAVSEPVAFDEISGFVESASMGSGAFSNTSENPQLLKDKVLNANSVLNYQIANLSYLPEHLAIDENTDRLGSITSKANKTFDTKAIEAQNESIDENAINSKIWNIATDNERVRKLQTTDPDNYKLITDALAFTIKNYHQIGNFTDNQHEHSVTSEFPTQSELRYALMRMEALDGKKVDELSVPVLDVINPIPDNTNNDLAFTNKDAQAIFNKIDVDLNRDDLTDDDVEKNNIIEQDLISRGFAKGSDFSLTDTPDLKNLGAAQGRMLLSSYLNNMESHRDYTTDGLASTLGSGNALSLPSSPSGGAFGDAVSEISQALVGTIDGTLHPSKIGVAIDDALTETSFVDSASPQNTTSNNSSQPEISANENSNTTTNNANSGNDAEPGANQEQSTSETNNNQQQNDSNELDEEQSIDEDQEKRNREAQEQENNGNKAKDHQKGVAAGGGAYTVSGAAALAHAIGRGIMSVGDMLRFPILSGLAQAASTGSPCDSDPSLSSKSKHHKLPDNVNRNLIKMNEAAIKFEIATKALEVNQTHKMLSPRDVKAVQKDAKKHFDAYNESALLSSESLHSMKDALSSDVRKNVAKQMSSTHENMRQSITEATKKDTFSLNPNQKKMADEADKAVTGIVSGLKSFIATKVFGFFGSKPR